MKVIKLIILVMIVHCYCLESYCKNINDNNIHSSTGELDKDSVKISLTELRKVNLCLIKLDIQNKIIIGKDSIIYLQNEKIKLYEDSYNKMKQNALASQRINAELENSLKRSNRQKIIYGGVAGGLATSLLLFILIK